MGVHLRAQARWIHRDAEGVTDVVAPPGTTHVMILSAVTASSVRQTR